MALEEVLRNISVGGPVPGHVQISEIIRGEIEAGHLQPGTRLPPERTLVEICGVSRSTVRQALDTLVREDLIEKHTGRGIFVASPPVKKGVACVLQALDPKYHWGLMLSQAIVSEAHEYGWKTVTYIMASDGDRTRLENDIKGNQIHGVLTVLEWELLEESVPTVHATLSRIEGYQVYIDYYSLIHQAASYLVNQGRRNIALATYEPQALSTREGMRAYQDVLKEHDLLYREGWVVQHHGLEEQGEAAVRQIWDQDERPDAFIFMDDWQGLGGTRALVELGVKVPEEVMVITHMNKGYNPPYPVPVAGIQVNPHAIAREMIHLLEALERGERPLRKMVTVEPTLLPIEKASIVLGSATP